MKKIYESVNNLEEMVKENGLVKTIKILYGDYNIINPFTYLLKNINWEEITFIPNQSMITKYTYFKKYKHNEDEKLLFELFKYAENMNKKESKPNKSSIKYIFNSVFINDEIREQFNLFTEIIYK